MQIAVDTPDEKFRNHVRAVLGMIAGMALIAVYGLHYQEIRRIGIGSYRHKRIVQTPRSSDHVKRDSPIFFSMNVAIGMCPAR